MFFWLLVFWELKITLFHIFLIVLEKLYKNRFLLLAYLLSVCWVMVPRTFCRSLSKLSLLSPSYSSTTTQLECLKPYWQIFERASSFIKAPLPYRSQYFPFLILIFLEIYVYQMFSWQKPLATCIFVSFSHIHYLSFLFLNLRMLSP